MNFTWQEFVTSKYNNKTLVRVKTKQRCRKIEEIIHQELPRLLLSYPCMYLPNPSRSEKRCHLLIVLWPRTRQMAASRTRLTAEQIRTHPEVFLGNKTFLQYQRERSIVNMEPSASIFKWRKVVINQTFISTLKNDAVRKSHPQQSETVGLGWTLLCFTHSASSELRITFNFLGSEKWKERRMNKRTNERRHEGTNGGTHARTNEHTKERTHERRQEGTNARAHERTNARTNEPTHARTKEKARGLLNSK